MLVRGLAWLVPVLGRPHRVEPLLASIAASTLRPCRVVFIADPDDVAEQEAVRTATGELLIVDGGYAAKINAAVRSTDEPLLFLGADDLTPQPGWLEAATAAMAAGAEVVGVNDMIPRRASRCGHATHFLVTRQYAERPALDGGRGPLCEEYAHNFVDDELIATAKRRGVYTYAADALVRHDHPMSGGADDDTYRKGRAAFHRDRKIFERRRRLWT